MGPKQRHVERCRYRPQDPERAYRPTRDAGGLIGQQTYKRAGDVAFDLLGRKWEVRSDGWN